MLGGDVSVPTNNTRHQRLLKSLLNNGTETLNPTYHMNPIDLHTKGAVTEHDVVVKITTEGKITLSKIVHITDQGVCIGHDLVKSAKCTETSTKVCISNPRGTPTGLTVEKTSILPNGKIVIKHPTWGHFSTNKSSILPRHHIPLDIPVPTTQTRSVVYSEPLAESTLKKWSIESCARIPSTWSIRRGQYTCRVELDDRIVRTIQERTIREPQDSPPRNHTTIRIPIHSPDSRRNKGKRVYT